MDGEGCGLSSDVVGDGAWEAGAWVGVGRVAVREGGRWCLEDSLPMTLESDLWLTEESSGLSRGVPLAVMERARVCVDAGLCATVAWAWARVGWVAGRAVVEVEMREAVGGAPGFESCWACERV